ncbi:MlaA family lipoprotein [Sulfurospirillum sp. 1612]|uniref:MlaA family lipoprotein n=1 Tax=Sulfurospirillum sp. 1612 TaxID=3094835 RepID=UPI002F95DB11
MRFLILTLYCISFLYAANPNTQSLDDFDAEFQTPQQNQVADPLSGYNKIMTNFNDFFYLNILDPVAKGYKTVVPTPLRTGIYNVFNNLLFPLRFLNNTLQLKFHNAFDETRRFLINSTLGVAGLSDVATNNFHIKAHDEDFGQTLGYYGAGSGFYLVLPILGPSNLRDTFGLVTDVLINPLNYFENRGYNIFDNSTQAYASGALEMINYSSFHVGEYKKLKNDAIELYPFLKNIYEQRRKKLIEE